MRIFCIVLLALLASCATMSPPSIARLGDNTFVLTHPMTIDLELPGGISQIVVPAGFMMDLASSPRITHVMEGKTDRSMGAAIVHDYLYWDQRCSKDEADAIFKLLMKQSQVWWLPNFFFGEAVSVFGGSSYDRNTSARSNGERRYMTDPYLKNVLSQNLAPGLSFKRVQEQATLAKGSTFDVAANPDLKSVCSRALVATRMISA